MITGFNANVRHRGRRFHVQTEDSGRAHPHVVTHLYHEGTILASERRDYAGLVGGPDLDARVRRLMEEQHASMVERLRAGDFDSAIAGRLGPPAASAPPEMATPAEPVPQAPRPPAGPRPPAAAIPAAAAAAAPAAAQGPAAPAGRARAFGEGIVSERPLDDVILDYLVAQSRERTGGGRGSRSEG